MAHAPTMSPHHRFGHVIKKKFAKIAVFRHARLPYVAAKRYQIYPYRSWATPHKSATGSSNDPFPGSALRREGHFDVQSRTPSGIHVRR